MKNTSDRIFPFLGWDGWNQNQDSDQNTKLNHDRYEVYVNGDYVGNKTLLTQNEHVTDVDDFLHQEGFTEFSSELIGDHYNLKAEENQSEKMKDNLKLYLKIR